MKKIHLTTLLERYCRLSGKWGIQVSLPYPECDSDEIKKWVPFLDYNTDAQCLSDGLMFVICDSEKIDSNNRDSNKQQ